MGDNPNPTTSIEVRTIRKVQNRILPFILILYIIAFLDRINIGFAALIMNQELAISRQQFGLLAGIFFVGYFLFEIPSNLLLHKIGAQVWIARILLSWGVVAVLTGFVQNIHQLFVVRFVLGVAEAGFVPGVLLYLTFWFRQQERARVGGLFLAGMPIASLLGGPLSGLILDHVHWFGLSSWRWLFILEGAPAMVFGLLTYFLLPSRPAEAKFLTSEERRWISAVLAREEQDKLAENKFSVMQTLINKRVWCLAAIYFGLIVGLYALTFWSPQLILLFSGRDSGTPTGFLVMIPSLMGMAGMILISWNSDRTLERRYHVAIPATVGGVSLVMLGTTHSLPIGVALLSFLAIGVYGIMGPFWALPGEFLTGFSAAAGLALINSAGNLGGFVGSFAIGFVTQKSGSFYGGLTLAGVCMFLSSTLVLTLPRRRQGLTG